MSSIFEDIIELNEGEYKIATAYNKKTREIKNQVERLKQQDVKDKANGQKPPMGMMNHGRFARNLEHGLRNRKQNKRENIKQTIDQEKLITKAESVILDIDFK